MTGPQLQLILGGLPYQSKLKTLTIQDNEIDDKCVETISHLCQRPNESIESLNIYFCKLGWKQTENLVDRLKTKNQL